MRLRERSDEASSARCENGAERVQYHEPVIHMRSMMRLPKIPYGDRKSTRLNSSHSQISYAVFCLKKKKPLNLFVRSLLSSFSESDALAAVSPSVQRAFSTAPYLPRPGRVSRSMLKHQASASHTSS